MISRIRFAANLIIAAAVLSPGISTLATENAPHAPFAQWADVPADGQWIFGAMYQESESYHFWAGSTQYGANWKRRGEGYGIDINQGYLTVQFGLNERWAADVAIGYTTVGWRHFSNGGNTNGQARSTTGLMDSAFGVRYQIWNETNANSGWRPTLTFRAGAILPGTFDQTLPFSPGDSSAAIEPEFLARKHFGWEGFGAYADGLFRWNRTSHNDHYIVSVGLLQQISTWELNVGYRHLGSVGGDNIEYDPVTREIDYPRAPRESNDSIEAGFSYTTKKRAIQIGFYSRTVVDGVNSDGKFWVGGYVNIPFDKKRKSE